MYQRVTAMTPEQRVQGRPVSDPALHERRLGRHRRPVPATEVVQNHDPVPAGEKLCDHDAADVPRSTGDEDTILHLGAPGRRGASAPRAGRSPEMKDSVLVTGGA